MDGKRRCAICGVKTEAIIARDTYTYHICDECATVVESHIDQTVSSIQDKARDEEAEVIARTVRMLRLSGFSIYGNPNDDLVVDNTNNDQNLLWRLSGIRELMDNDLRWVFDRLFMHCDIVFDTNTVTFVGVKI